MALTPKAAAERAAGLRPLRTIHVATYWHPRKNRPCRVSQVHCYTRDYNPQWDGYVGFDVEAASGTEAKRVAARLRVEHETDDRSEPTEAKSYSDNRVALLDEQDGLGITTYEVVLSHMDHGVVIYRGEDRGRANELAFVISHELNVAHSAGAGRVYHEDEEPADG